MLGRAGPWERPEVVGGLLWEAWVLSKPGTTSMNEPVGSGPDA